MILHSEKLPIIFLGASDYVLPIIEFLKRDYDLKLVVTTERDPHDPVPTYCQKNNIPLLSVISTKALMQQKEALANSNAPVAVLADFGLIIPEELLTLFPKGIVNIHPSRLPLYRGPTPGQTAILLGDIRTGVSVMLLDKDIDHGPILAQEEEDISSTDTAATLYTRLFTKGARMLVDVLPAYLSGQLVPKEQNHTKATFTKPLTRESGFVDNTKPISPELLDRMIRAYYPWPGAWTRLRLSSGGQANSSRLEGKIIKFLPNEMLQVEGKKPVSKKDFINGYPQAKAWIEQILK